MGSSEYDVVLGLGDFAVAPRDSHLRLSSLHPSAPGGTRLRLRVEGDRIVHAETQIGQMHRGAEKLFETRDYRQAMMLANRHDWLSAYNSELGLALTIERMCGIEVPERATWIRMLLAELNRALAQLAFIGSFVLPDGVLPRFHAYAERTLIQSLMEQVTGGRMHFMHNRVGGVLEDLPSEWLPQVRPTIERIGDRLPALIAAMLNNDVSRERLGGVGIVTREQCEQYGLSGPVARASGAAFDLRRDEPYLAYAALGDALRVVTRTDGDCAARFACLLDEVAVSLDLVGEIVERLTHVRGPINVRLPKVLRVPEGYTHCWTENPTGISGYLLVSRGGRAPWRLKARTPSFNNVSVLSELLTGARLIDVIPIITSLFYVTGDRDR